jgi:hypothetical protein
MSYTTIVHVFPNEKVECGEELRNSWGSAPYVWFYLGDKYVINFSMHKDQSMKDLWKLWKIESVPFHQRAVLMMTFDRAYVSKENYERAANDIRLFLEDHNDPNVVNHWPRIAEIFESNPDVPGIGLYCTSVSENPFSGSWNDEKEDYDPPNWDEVYEIYSELDGLGS